MAGRNICGMEPPSGPPPPQIVVDVRALLERSGTPAALRLQLASALVDDVLTEIEENEIPSLCVAEGMLEGARWSIDNATSFVRDLWD
jgi:hypothetical protein